MIIEKSTVQFLKNLRKNNEREWFHVNKPKYQAALENFIAVTQQIINGIAKFDPTLEDVEAKNCLFRIYRDVRFSKDKTPYKSHLVAKMTPIGRKGIEIGGYYFYLSPQNKSLLLAGLYAPPTPKLNKIRQEIDYNGKSLHQIIDKAAFKKDFELYKDHSLVRIPKGYDAEHQDAEYLRLKSFIYMQKVSDADVLDPKFAKTAISKFKKLQPFVKYLNTALDD